MKKIIYLIRHIQISPSPEVHHSLWPPSDTGRTQAEQLVAPLQSLLIESLYSSPFLRCLETVKHYCNETQIPPIVHDGLRERSFGEGFEYIRSTQIWNNSWSDFNFTHDGGETSFEAQARIVKAVNEILSHGKGDTIALCSHGNLISLFLNHVEPTFHRSEAEKIRNPDVLKVNYENSRFKWDSDFTLPGLDKIATHFSQMKVSSSR